MTEPTRDPQTWESLSSAAAHKFRLDADELKKEVHREMVSMLAREIARLVLERKQKHVDPATPPRGPQSA
jgi:hypothetical protein